MKTAWIFRRPEYTPDVAEAFNRIGWQAELLDEREMMVKLIAGEKPTLVLMNKAGRGLDDKEPEGTVTVLSLCEERKIPFVWWIFDAWYFDHRMVGRPQQKGAETLGLPYIQPMSVPDAKCLWTFTVHRDHMPALKGNCVEYLPFGVNERRFVPMHKKYDYPVGFVGTSLIGSPIDGMTIIERAGLAEKLRQGVDLGDDGTAGTWRLLIGVRESAYERINGVVAAQADVWGDGWEQVAPGGAIRYHGRADWATELPGILNRCAVNLNISKVMFKEDIAPRTLEILSCGMPMLSNSLPGLWREFADVATFYDGTEHLKEQLERMRRDHDRTWARAAAARRLVVDKHTWEHRVRRIVEVVRG